MTEQSKHINYSAADIERYFNGKMPAAEMYALEKAALQDSLLADALEGYAGADFEQAKHHLKDIEQTVLNGKRSTKVVPLLQSKSFNRIIAASVIVVAITGIVVYEVMQPASKEQKQTVAITPATDTTLIASQKQNNNKTGAVTLAAPSFKKEKTIKQHTPTPQPGLLAASEKKDTEQAGNSIQLQDVATFKTAPVKSKDVAAAIPPIADSIAIPHEPKSLTALAGRVAGMGRNKLQNYAIRGRVTTAKGKPIPFATIMIPDKKISTTTDGNGSFELSLRDSTAKVQVSALGFEEMTTALSFQSNNHVSLKESEQSLSEVVVTALNTKKSKKISDAGFLKESLAKDSLMPDGGWNAYRDYIRSQIKIDSFFNGIPYAEIEFEFNIDKQGKAMNVEILKSPSTQINPYLIEAIEKGPKWLSNSGNKKSKKKAKINLQTDNPPSN